MAKQETRPSMGKLIGFLALYVVVGVISFITSGYNENVGWPTNIGFAFILAFWVKGYHRSFWGYLILGVLFSPLISVIVLILLTKRQRDESAYADAIQMYKQLLDSGAITQEEYEEKKKQLLDI